MEAPILRERSPSPTVPAAPVGGAPHQRRESHPRVPSDVVVETATQDPRRHSIVQCRSRRWTTYRWAMFIPAMSKRAFYDHFGQGARAFRPVRSPGPRGGCVANPARKSSQDWEGAGWPARPGAREGANRCSADTAGDSAPCLPSPRGTTRGAAHLAKCLVGRRHEEGPRARR